MKPTARLFAAWISPALERALIRPFFERFPDGELFVVGGAVRDALLGRTAKRDLDLVARGVPGSTLERFLKEHGRVHYVGRTFGVWKFDAGAGADSVDIALPRTESPMKTGGYRDVIVKSRADLPIAEDLGRRDFTINAMAWSLKDGRLVDPWKGMADLSARRVRAVRNPEERFREDYTRMLRALRFAVELDATIVPATWNAIKKNAKQLVAERGGRPVVARELVAKEFLKSLAAHPAAAIRLWDKAGALDVLMPEAIAMKGCAQPRNFHTEGDVWRHALLAVEMLETPKFRREHASGWNAEVALATFLHDVAKPRCQKTPAKDKVERICFPGHDAVGAEMAAAIIDRLALASFKAQDIDVDRERVAFAVRHHLLAVHGKPKEMLATTIEKHFFAQPAAAELLLKVMFADGSATIAANGRPMLAAYRALKKRIAEVAAVRGKPGKRPAPLLRGEEIMRLLKLAPGPKVGEIVAALREAQLTGTATTPAAARAWLIKTYGNG
ncbi:CCA tRNA nucleotidyltransferase [Patescibacteria group bacterium]|nr:MAG: CCA tRNA nucleotidyltransferase [Patescibacteria group bacterium]